MGKITEEMPMNITVYLGANEGSDPALKQAVEELGKKIMLGMRPLSMVRRNTLPGASRCC